MISLSNFDEFARQYPQRWKIPLELPICLVKCFQLVEVCKIIEPKLRCVLNAAFNYKPVELLSASQFIVFQDGKFNAPIRKGLKTPQKFYCCPIEGCPRGPNRPFSQFSLVKQVFLFPTDQYHTSLFQAIFTLECVLSHSDRSKSSACIQGLELHVQKLHVGIWLVNLHQRT